MRSQTGLPVRQSNAIVRMDDRLTYFYLFIFNPCDLPTIPLRSIAIDVLGTPAVETLEKAVCACVGPRGEVTPQLYRKDSGS